MLPLHHDPGRDTSCRGIRLVQIIASVLATSSVCESGRPDSNRRSQAPRACGLARLSHALIVPASSPCGNRTHLSALKGRYPLSDRRTGHHASGPGGARIHVCGSSGRRYTVSATGPSNEEARLSHDAGPWANRRGCVGRGVRGAAERRAANSPVDRRDDPLQIAYRGDWSTRQTS